MGTVKRKWIESMCLSAEEEARIPMGQLSDRAKEAAGIPMSKYAGRAQCPKCKAILSEGVGLERDRCVGCVVDERDDLLAACKAFMSGPPAGVVDKMRAAIAKAEQVPE